MLGQAFLLMIIGMGAVMVFLVLLVFLMNLLEKLTREVRAREALAAKPRTPTPTVSGATQAVTAAISAAVHQFRNNP